MYINQVINWIEEGTREAKCEAFDRIADLDNVWLSQYNRCESYLSVEEYSHFKNILQELMREL